MVWCLKSVFYAIFSSKTALFYLKSTSPIYAGVHVRYTRATPGYAGDAQGAALHDATVLTNGEFQKKYRTHLPEEIFRYSILDPTMLGR